MARIELNIVALGDFSSVNNQIKALQAQVNLLNKSLSGVGAGGGIVKELNAASMAFKSALLSSGQFTQTTVKMTNETDKFGKSLVNGKLKLSEYFGIITGKSAQATASLRALAAEQVKLQNSIVMGDPTKRGVFSVFTPTQIDKVANATKLAAMQQNLYNMSLEGGSKALINWGKNTQWAGRQLTVGLTMPMVLFGSSAAKIFQDVNDQLVRLQKVYGDGLKQPTQEALDSIKQQTVGLAKELAASMGVAATDTAGMAADLAATGLKGLDLIEGTREAMRLARLGELEQQAAMTATVSLQNVYKLSTQELAGAVNFLNAVENQTSTSLQDLVDGIPRVGPIVQQLGGSFKDTAVMMVAMKEAGVPAAQAANAIKSGLASLINPTKVASAMFEEYNINLRSISESAAGNPIKMIMGLQQALSNLDPLTQARLIEQLFGKFQQARMQALITNLGAVNSQTRTAFELAQAGAPQLAAIAAQELRVATESTTGKFRRAVESLKANLIPVGEKILQVATAVINFADKIAAAFGALPGPVQSFLGIFMGGAAIAGPIIMLTGLMGNFAGYILKAIYNLRNLASGGTTFKQLLTPELIASSNAATLFGTTLQNDVNAVNLLNGAIARLTASIEAMNIAMARSAGGLPIVPTPGVPQGLRNIPFRAPGMAKGGFVPGDPAQGDIHPAVLTGGEAVIPAGPAQKYKTFISALIRGDLGQHAYGIDPTTGMAFDVQRMHSLSGHGDDILELMNTAEMLSQQGAYGLTKVNRVTKGAMIGGTSWLNQLTKGAVGNRQAGPGADAATVIDEFRKITQAGIDPMEELARNAEKLGADMSTARPRLDRAYQQIIDDLGEASKAGTVFGMRPGQVPLESFIEERLRPALQDINTAAGLTMDDVTQRIVGTRGVGRGRSGSSGQVYYIEDDGSIVPLKDSSIGKSLSARDVHTVGGNVPGSIEGKAREYNKSMGFLDKVKTGMKTKLRIKSPSETFAEDVGDPIAAGVAKGIDDGTPKVVSAGEKQVDSLAAAQEKRSRIINRRMMMGTGLGMVGMMAGGAIGNIGGGNNAAANMAGSVVSNVGMAGMFASFIPQMAAFLPQILAVVAAITVLTKGIQYLIKEHKEQQAQAKATFTSSAEVAQFFGKTVADTTLKVSEFGINFEAANAKVIPGINSMQTELAKFKEMLKSLPADNPLSLVVQRLKEASDSGSIAKIAEDFVTMQAALNNIDPAKAQTLYNLLLAASGKAGFMGATITIADQMTAVSNAIFNASGDAKTLQQAITQLYSAASNSTSMSQFKNIIEGIDKAGIPTKDKINALADAFISIGDYKGVQALKTLQSLKFSMGEIVAIMAAVNKGATLDFKGKTNAQIVAEAKTAVEEANKKLAAQNKQYVDSNKNLTANNNALEARIKALKLEKKQLDANITAQERMNKLLSDEQRFNMTKGELENKMRIAQAGGNFLEANLLRQQILSETSDYNREKGINELRNQSADKGIKIAGLEELLNANKNAISNNNTVINNNTNAMNNLPENIAGALKNLPGFGGPGGTFIPPSKGQYMDKPVGEDFAGLMFSKNGKSYTAVAGSRSYEKVWKEWTSKGYTFEGYDPDYAAAAAKINWKNPLQWDTTKLPTKYPKATTPPKREFGGPTFKDQMYLVGEKGPEFFVPNTNGSIIPNDMTSRMMNQSSNVTNEYALNLTFNGSQMNPDDVAKTVMDAIKRAGNSNSVYTNRRVIS